jgi:hypothetical protein
VPFSRESVNVELVVAASCSAALEGSECKLLGSCEGSLRGGRLILCITATTMHSLSDFYSRSLHVLTGCRVSVTGV